MRTNILSAVKSIPKRVWLIVILAFLFGALWTTAIRFVLVEKKEVHHHANFGIFINGERKKLESFTYFEEVASCMGDDQNNPKARVHMHDKIDHVVHVHDGGATWGHLFANLGFTVGNEVIKIEDEVFVESDTLPITFTLNGQEVDTIANRVIDSEDKLLISIGTDADETLASQYGAIETDAAEYNLKNDPSSCSGGKPLTFFERLKLAIGVNSDTH